MRIITFSEFKAYHEPLCKQLGILKFVDNIEVNNCVFVYDFLNKSLPVSYVDTFARVEDKDTTSTTRQASTGILHLPKFSGITFGLKCIYNRCIMSWNKYTLELNKVHKQKFVNKMRCTDLNFLDLSRKALKEILTKHILEKYVD